MQIRGEADGIQVCDIKLLWNRYIEILELLQLEIQTPEGERAVVADSAELDMGVFDVGVNFYLVH